MGSLGGAHTLRGGAHRSLWTGEQQWKGLLGEFDFGQEGLVLAVDGSEVFMFYPALGVQRGQGYQVLCTPKDFLVLIEPKNA